MLEEALARVAEAFRRSPGAVARLTRTLEDLCGFVETVGARERVRAYLVAAEPTGVDELETARRELLDLAHESNNFLDSARRERFERLWREWRARYGEHYAALHDKTVGSGGARDSLRDLRRSERWREFESLARLPVVSAQVWRQAEGLLRVAEGVRCGLDVRRLLAGQPVCACQFRLSRAEELSELPQELEALMERGLVVYRRTLGMLGGSLAISLDALGRRDGAARAQPLGGLRAGSAAGEVHLPGRAAHRARAQAHAGAAARQGRRAERRVRPAHARRAARALRAVAGRAARAARAHRTRLEGGD
jgi:hypothetical protein